VVTTIESRTFSPSQEYVIGEPNVSPRRLENMQGSDFIFWTLGERGVGELFGFNDEELIKAKSRPREEIFGRTMSDAEVEKKFKSSMWRMYDLKREYERFLAASRHPQLLRTELIEGINNIWTTFTEYAWGKNTKYYYKIVRNPTNDKTKLVMYDPKTQESESWEDAWKREDMRLVNSRFIEVKSTKDAKYKNNYGQLKKRDLLEGELMNLLVAQGSGIFAGKDAATLMSVSPSPSPSKYARDMGYGATLFKQLSHWRIYSFNRMDENTIFVDATTVFTYRTKRRLREVMIEVVNEEPAGLNTDKVRNLRDLPSHIDILSVPFTLSTNKRRTEELVDLVDEALNTDQFLSEDYLSVFSYIATRWHKNNRMTDKIAAKNIFSSLVKDFVWQYYCILAEGNLQQDEMLLKEKLILMMEKGAVLYAQRMTDSIEKVRGKPLSKRERGNLEKSFIGAVVERSKGGLCPTVGSEESSLKNSERDRNSGTETQDSIRCGVCKETFTKDQIKVVYHKRSGKENRVCPYCSCDVCGVKHGEEWTTEKGLYFDLTEEPGYRGEREKLIRNEDRSVQFEPKRLDNSDYDLQARAARSKVFNRVVFDSSTGELVVLDLIPLRRKLSTLQIRELTLV
jgi:hypothetical protein